MRFLCKIGIHKWIYPIQLERQSLLNGVYEVPKIRKFERKCTCCGIIQKWDWHWITIKEPTLINYFNENSIIAPDGKLWVKEDFYKVFKPVKEEVDPEEKVQ